MIVTFNAGPTWNPLLAEYCAKMGYESGLDSTQKVDLVIYHAGRYTAVELKATDLHQSLCGKGDQGHLETELKTYYLTKYDRVWLYVAGHQEDLDLQMLASKCFKYGVAWKYYAYQVSAVEGIFRAILEENVIDLAAPEYINEADSCGVLERMLRQFPGLTGDKIVGLMAELKGTLSPAEILFAIEPLLTPENLQRLWHDWFHGGVEPKQNRLTTKRVKATQRAEGN